MTANRQRRLSPSAVAVLSVVRDGVTYGFDVMDATGLSSGTVYPILARMATRGLVESSWEDPALSRGLGRPARKHYRLTPAGREALDAATAHYRALGSLHPEEA